MKIRLTLNGERRDFDVRTNALLIDILRSAGFTSVKRGCESGECGACTVIIDGVPRASCIMLAVQADGRSVITAEALGSREELHPLQKAFIDAGAIQCGYCTPAMLLVLDRLLKEKGEPTENDVREALSGILCRCTGYVKPVEAALEGGSRDA